MITQQFHRHKKLAAIKLVCRARTLEPWALAEFFGPQLKRNARLPEVRAAEHERTYTFHVCVIIPQRNCIKKDATPVHTHFCNRSLCALSARAPYMAE